MGEGGGGGGCCHSSAAYEVYFGRGDEDCIAWQTTWENADGDRLFVWSFATVNVWDKVALVFVAGVAIVVIMEGRARQAWDMVVDRERRRCLIGLYLGGQLGTVRRLQSGAIKSAFERSVEKETAGGNGS